MLNRHVDRIELNGIRAVGTIGVLDHERQSAQPFEVDLVLEFDARQPGQTDNLEHTINYALPVEIASRVIATEQHELLEKVATRIAEDVLEIAGVDAVEVTLRKLRPPLPHDVQTSGVCIYRRRPDLTLHERPLQTAYIAVGSNLGDRRETLRFAIINLPGVRAISGVYETDPIGGPDGQDAYLNMVAEVETHLDPFSLLDACRRIELAAGRERKVRWGPRTLDLDVLLYGGVSIQSEELTIPHPRMWERRFVLAPLADVAPHRVPSDWNDRLPAGGIHRVEDLDL